MGSVSTEFAASSAINETAGVYASTASTTTATTTGVAAAKVYKCNGYTGSTSWVVVAWVTDAAAAAANASPTTTTTTTAEPTTTTAVPTTTTATTRAVPTAAL